MSKRILFFPQNETHISNMLPIANALNKHGCYCKIVDTTRIYHQRISIPRDYLYSIDYQLEQPFYRLPIIARIQAIIKFKTISEPLFKDENWDCLIIGNDGSLQRVLLNIANKNNIQTILLLDGIISDYELRAHDVITHSNYKILDLKSILTSKCRGIIWNFFRNTSLSPFIPSEIGGTKITDIITIGEHSKKIIAAKNPNARIHALGLPRFWNNNSELKDFDSINNIITYFPSAFIWHNLKQEATFQQKDIILLCQLIDNHNSTKEDKWQLHIKIHPRENINDYCDLSDKYKFVKLIQDGSVENCLKKSKICISTISTVIIEAMKLGISVYSLMINFQYWKYKYSFIGDENIPKIFSVEDLNKILFAQCKSKISASVQKASNKFCNSTFNMDKIVALIVS